MRRLRGDGGFTLVELAIALTVVAIVTGMAVPAYLSFLTSTRAAQAVADLQAVRAAVYLYYGDLGRWPNEAPAGFVPTGLRPNLPKNFAFSNRYYTLDYDNWIPLFRRGRAPAGTTTAVGVSIVSRDPRILLRIQHLIRDAKFTRISRTKYILEIATLDGF